MTIIYSLEESARLTKRTQAELIDLGCSGAIQFLIDVPKDAKIGNVGWGETKEATDPATQDMLWETRHLSPIWETDINLLALEPNSCKTLRERGTLRQAEFSSAAAFTPESELKIIRPSVPRNHPSRLGKRHNPIRIFAAYDRNVFSQDNAIVPTKELVITVSQLLIAEKVLQPYLANQVQQTSLQPLPSETKKKKKKGKKIDELSRFIKRKIYDPATAEEKENDDVLWRKFCTLAEKNPSEKPLIDAVPEGVLYSLSLGDEKTLTYKQFCDRLGRIRMLGQKN